MMYSVCDFSGLESIGVLCRGDSLSYLPHVSDAFEACFLVGQFQNSLKRVGDNLLDKSIVQVINKCAIQADRKTCEKFNIKDIQCNFGSYFGEEISKEKSKLYDKIKKKNPWANIHLVPIGLAFRRPMNKWETTGIFAVDLAAFFNPKKIHIIGLDFYESDYFCKERLQAGIKKNRTRGSEMRKQFMRIVNRDKNIMFNIYTKSEHLKSKDNLNVTIV